MVTCMPDCPCLVSENPHRGVCAQELMRELADVKEVQAATQLHDRVLMK